MSNMINGLEFVSMLENGAKNLALNEERINSLNVFPVPDGDTGTNMRMTIDGGAVEGINQKEESIGKLSKIIARAMVLSARGNSGVILSQFFKGLSMGLENYDEVSVNELSKAMISGTNRAYSVVSNPTEGTILTVMREAGEIASDKVYEGMSIVEYLEVYLFEAKKSLDRTPELLPVLKKAGVIDSGGAGFILIIEGMIMSLKGETIKDVLVDSVSKNVNTKGFNADSELEYGYCTEFILQLQNSKVNPNTFDLNIINDFLNSIGNSIVSFKDEDIVKVHVHTFDPGLVLTEMRKYGEFLTVKIENMNVSHTSEEEVVKKEHKQYAIVAVANGAGLTEAFKNMGVDEIVYGGQTMNASTLDFITAFDKISADYIFVYPNNSNIMLAANVAASSYDKANIIVVPTRTIAEGYSAISMLNFDSNDVEQITLEQGEVIDNVSTLEVTYSIRDAIINDIEVKKNDFICLYNDELISANPNRLVAIKEAFNKIDDFEDKQVLTFICGKDSSQEEFEELFEHAQKINSYIEAYSIDGKQDVYSYIIGIE